MSGRLARHFQHGSYSASGVSQRRERVDVVTLHEEKCLRGTQQVEGAACRPFRTTTAVATAESVGIQVESIDKYCQKHLFSSFEG